MGLPQREGRPALSIAPEDSIPEPGKAWEEDYDDLGMNPLNHPVPLHTGKFPVNGWLEVASDVTPTAGTGGGKAGSEKR
jgi:hypothetical protein